MRHHTGCSLVTWSQRWTLTGAVLSHASYQLIQLFNLGVDAAFQGFLVSVHSDGSLHATPSLCLQFPGVAGGPQQPRATCHRQAQLQFCLVLALVLILVLYLLTVTGHSSAFSLVSGSVLGLDFLPLQREQFTLFLLSTCMWLQILPKF